MEHYRSILNEIASQWLHESLAKEMDPQPYPLCEESCSSDYLIVGGGFTGLWTAIMLKKEKPEAIIRIIEQKACGFGASGSNGGCLLTLSTKFLGLQRFYGEAEAVRLVQESEKAVHSIKEFVAEHKIECDLRVDGVGYVATNAAQRGKLDKVIQALQSKGINSWEKMDVEQAKSFANLAQMEEMYFSPLAGSVQPADLTRGLARVAKEMGVIIHEHTPMVAIDLEKVTITTDRCTLSAGKIILCINAWMASRFRAFRNSMITVSSDMILTRPNPARLHEAKLGHGATICDSRIFVHYMHSTSDGRLLIGKGGNTFAYASRMISSFLRPSRMVPLIRKGMEALLPSFRGAEIHASWNGGSDRTATGFPIFGKLEGNSKILYGFGYSGNGVTQSYLGGKTLCSLALDREDEWSRAGWVSGIIGYFPPEPIRYFGANLVKNCIRRKERFEERNWPVLPFDKWMSTFANAFGKSDH